VISPKQFKEFGQPYLTRLVDFIHGHGRGVTLHICGKTRAIWEQMADTGADCLSIDNAADLLEAKVKVGTGSGVVGVGADHKIIAVLCQTNGFGARL
jgi:uroporphyrinogen decarboxylase